MDVREASMALPLIGALTRDQARNPSVARRHSSQPSHTSQGGLSFFVMVSMLVVRAGEMKCVSCLFRRREDYSLEK